MAQAPKRKNTGLRIIVWLIVLGALASPAIYYFMREEVLDVTATALTRDRVETTITAMSSGTVKAVTDSMVAGGTLGKVVAIPIKEGDRVKTGDLLVELEHEELDAQLALAEANLRVGQSRHEQAKMAATIYEEISRTRVNQADAQANVAKLDFDRVKSLSDRKAVSQSDFDKITMMLRVATETQAAAKAAQQENQVRQEEIKSAEALIEQLEAAASAARTMRDKAYVRAPFDGVVAKVFVHLGEGVGGGMGGGGLGAGLGAAGAGAGMGLGGGGGGLASGAGMSMPSAMALVQLVQDSELYIKAPFDEANMAQIKEGMKARIGLDAYRGKDFAGTVTYISPTVTRNLDLSRTLDLDVRIDEERDKFVVGMSADVIIVVNEKPDVLFIPTEALIREEEAYVIENGRAVKRKVTIGIGNWQRREIIEGLTEGETVITSIGVKGLKGGVKVHVVDNLDQS